ncbi:hypothetical protein EDC01DRAFT_97983 [Geopyxis carbonaria]|nr:hypothetical protein EDC01DRAFT_97983 [Geopyxis carbonaria]
MRTLLDTCMVWACPVCYSYNHCVGITTLPFRLYYVCTNHMRAQLDLDVSSYLLRTRFSKYLVLHFPGFRPLCDAGWAPLIIFGAQQQGGLRVSPSPWPVGTINHPTSHQLCSCRPVSSTLHCSIQTCAIYFAPLSSASRGEGGPCPPRLQGRPPELNSALSRAGGREGGFMKQIIGQAATNVEQGRAAASSQTCPDVTMG